MQVVDVDDALRQHEELHSQGGSGGESESKGQSDDEDEPTLEAMQDEGHDGNEDEEGGGISEAETTDSEIDESELQKLDEEQRQSLISAYHPEAIPDNFAEVQAKCAIRRDAAGQIDDPHHKTIPFMTKYEVTRVLGMRASQLDHGALPLSEVPSGVLDGYQIARQELLDKNIPFIIRRPLPDGAFEYWRAQDLEVLFPIAPVASQMAAPSVATVSTSTGSRS